MGLAVHSSPVEHIVVDLMEPFAVVAIVPLVGHRGHHHLRSNF